MSDLDTAAREAAPMLATGISVSSLGCTGSCGWPKSTGDQITVTTQYTFNPGYFRFLAKTLSQTTRVVCE
jgi:hypothetical protein